MNYEAYKYYKIGTSFTQNYLSRLLELQVMSGQQTQSNYKLVQKSSCNSFNQNKDKIDFKRYQQENLNT